MKRIGTGIPYKITPKDNENQILEIKLSNSLDNGNYCFVQGDPLGSPFSIPYWCFRIGNNTASQSTTESIATQNLITPNPTPQLTLNQEVIAFRDEVLQTIQSVTSVEYSIKADNNVTGNGEATINAIHETYYDENGNVSFEFINVDNTICNKNETTWNCNSEDRSRSIFLTIRNVLNGEPTVYHPLDGKVINSGSKLESYNETECRAFVVETSRTSNNEEYKVADEFCFDLITHLPIYRVTTNINLAEGVVTDQYITEAFDFKFNAPVNIILPQP